MLIDYTYEIVREDNLWDTVLAYKIDEKTGIIDLYNMQEKIFFAY